MDPALTKPENVPTQVVPSRRLKGCSLASLHAHKSTPGYKYIEHLLLHGDHSWKAAPYITGKLQ
ncbi:hypothetical protein ARMGADRAFT_1012073 [Armillaria gallica]|uniref:Uncharacterized protein n=1 Tax=Armillaria gallica TaxID=47427 RepID=A0A2H3DF97_ARMGA|nr:hypothetical protein ARMGADRAFT_1012073 [Armillaria gallica]